MGTMRGISDLDHDTSDAGSSGNSRHPSSRRWRKVTYATAGHCGGRQRSITRPRRHRGGHCRDDSVQRRRSHLVVDSHPQQRRGGRDVHGSEVRGGQRVDRGLLQQVPVARHEVLHDHRLTCGPVAAWVAVCTTQVRRSAHVHRAGRSIFRLRVESMAGPSCSSVCRLKRVLTRFLQHLRLR